VEGEEESKEVVTDFSQAAPKVYPLYVLLVSDCVSDKFTTSMLLLYNLPLLANTLWSAYV